jgi:hypothetical protein
MLKGTRVGNRLAVSAKSGRAKRNGVHLELPVSLLGKRGVGEITGVVSRIYTSKYQFSSLNCHARLTKANLSRFRVHVPVQPKGKNGLRYNALREQVVPHWGHVVNRDRIERKSKNAIKTGSEESDSGFSGNLSELLSLHGSTSKAQVIGAYKTRSSSRAILDGKLGSIGLLS